MKRSVVCLEMVMENMKRKRYEKEDIGKGRDNRKRRE